MNWMKSHTMLTRKDKIYYNVWCCAYQRRYLAKQKGDWALYDREHETILMCLHFNLIENESTSMENLSNM